MKPIKIESVKAAIIENGKHNQKWQFGALAGELYWWVDFFNIVFFTDQPVPIPVIAFSNDRVTTRGHFKSKHNGFGVTGTLVLNRNHLDRPMFEILVTLLHELTHAWQALYGTPSTSWFHNQEFRQKMANCGVTCDTKGHQTHLADPFVFLLQQRGVSFSGGNEVENRMTPMPCQQGRSKLKKWSCGCTNVRVAVADFKARCLKCNSLFQRRS